MGLLATADAFGGGVREGSAAESGPWLCSKVGEVWCGVEAVRRPWHHAAPSCWAWVSGGALVWIISPVWLVNCTPQGAAQEPHLHRIEARGPGSYLSVQKAVENGHHKALGRESKNTREHVSKGPSAPGVREVAGVKSDTRKPKNTITWSGGHLPPSNLGRNGTSSAPQPWSQWLMRVPSH